MELELKGKSVVVLASSSGLGKAAALEFLREGAEVTISSSNEAKLAETAGELERESGKRPYAVVADIKKAEQVERLIASAAEKFGGVYALVNNCGGPPAGPFETFGDAAWVDAFELTLLSYVRATRAVLPLMKSGGGGRIVNYTSSSVKAPIEGLILSNTFRTGVVGLSKTLALELGKDNILVNVVGPGRIQTDRITHLDGIRAKKAGITPEQVKANTAKEIPVGRYGSPEEMAKLTVFLASPANTYITGQTMLVDGGMTKAY